MGRRKNNRGSLDTNTLLRLVLGDVPNQTAAVDARLADDGVFTVSSVALVEMVFVLEKIYDLPRPVVSENIRALLKHPNLNCDKKLFGPTLRLYLAESKLSIVDCLLVCEAELNGALPLHTFDKDLAKATGHNVKLLC